MTYRRKLIEVAFPLEGVDLASAREKEPFTPNHPRSLHVWWARRPLAACRAILFASLVDDPNQSGVPEALLQQIDLLPPQEERDAIWDSSTPGEQRRQKLLSFLERLALWESRSNPKLLSTARELIRAATEGNPPPVMDPFCGGGSIPLEAQRLGLESHAADLNPVAVLITRALIEFPQKQAGIGPVNPVDLSLPPGIPHEGTTGLASDIRYYGKWIYQEAKRLLIHLYPEVRLPVEHGGEEISPTAWIWSRTARCPKQECGGWTPLTRTFWLSNKKGKKVWIEPRVEPSGRAVHFTIRAGDGSPREGTISRHGATCIFCGAQVPFSYLRSEGRGGRMRHQLMAIVVKNRRSRIYLPPQRDTSPTLTEEELRMVQRAQEGFLAGSTPPRLTGGCCHAYGLTTWGSLFSSRQIVALSTFGQLVPEMRKRIVEDGISAGLEPETAADYANAVATYLVLSLSRWMDLSNALANWNRSNENVRALFARQAIPMGWDFVELSPFGPLAPPTSFFESASAIVAEQSLADVQGKVTQQDAATMSDYPTRALVCTDPPYYDNVAYGDLSDFFYGWLRHCLGECYPDLFKTPAASKDLELVATPYRFKGGRREARTFFEQGLALAFSRMREMQHPDYPITLFYAFKQAEIVDAESNTSKGSPAITSDGWEAMLEGLIGAGFMITASWPLRSERRARSVALGTTALGTSMALVCRPRPASSPTMTEQQFVAALNAELPAAIRRLREQGIAPVDLAQAAIGPGMAIFSRCEWILQPNGQPLSTRTALAWINSVLEGILVASDATMDAPTRWAIAWFEKFGTAEGPLETAEALAATKGLTIPLLSETGIILVSGHRVRLRTRDELPVVEKLALDQPTTVWQISQQLIGTMAEEGSGKSVSLPADLAVLGEMGLDLAYRLYSICHRKRWSREAQSFNRLAIAIVERARPASRTAAGRANFAL